MKVVDEYIVLRLLDPQWESSLLDERLVLPYSRHWRLLSALGAPSRSQGQLSQRLQSLSSDAVDFIRRPHPDVLHVPDPRDHILLAAELLNVTGASSLMFAETLAACIAFESDFHCGAPRNAIGQLAERAAAIDVVIRIED